MHWYFSSLFPSIYIATLPKKNNHLKAKFIWNCKFAYPRNTKFRQNLRLSFCCNSLHEHFSVYLFIGKLHPCISRDRLFSLSPSLSVQHFAFSLFLTFLTLLKPFISFLFYLPLHKCLYAGICSNDNKTWIYTNTYMHTYIYIHAHIHT